ncbi:hypothetical protein LRS13_23105 [Svornostia abyssi]|uniref:Uncharacterized protein n=1 Tax=Svornostia abyssi TaxID=2898438 RepID=A0ABY5PFW3_9ACTN|nr:hypothetical protein LRS13_23105 [Parviterribacteraceae bacterium J379]
MPLSLSRLLTGLLVALLLSCVPATDAFAWGEVERRDLPELLGPPTKLPAYPAEVARRPRPTIPSVGERLATKQRPLAVDVDSDGTLYVVAQGAGFPIEGNTIGVSGWPFSGYLYHASLVTIYRVAPDLGEVEEIRTFLAQTETGFPDALNESTDPPAGLALDRSLRKLYVSVAGSGVWSMDLGTDAWGSGPLIADDHDVWVPYENETAFDDSGEGLTSPAVVTRDSTGAATSTLYGTLWEDGPSVPAQVAVDPQTHNLLVGEAAGVSQDADRNFVGPLQVREFSPAGVLIGTVDLDARGAGLSDDEARRFPAPDGRFSSSLLYRPGGPPPWLLSFGDSDSNVLRTRVARIATDTRGGDTRLVLLNQLTSLLPDGGFDTTIGQVIGARRGPDHWRADRVISARGGPRVRAE